MIAKQHKLTTKEVNYLMRRKQSVYVDGYKILYCDQYLNNQYHQTGIQVSGKVHKHAVQRNIIRRAFYAAREDQIDKATHNHYHKIFIVIHPEHCEFIEQLIESERLLKIVNNSESPGKEKDNKKTPHLKSNPHQQLKSHFNSIIISALWKINKTLSKPWSPTYNRYGKSSISSPSRSHSMTTKTSP